jgi:hypothetical protein
MECSVKTEFEQPIHTIHGEHYLEKHENGI